MKKMDEMDRHIQLLAEELAYKVALGALAGSTCSTCLQAFLTKQPLNVIPGLILCMVLFSQTFAQVIFKHQMVEGDEEYKEPNKPAWILGAVVALSVFILIVGFSMKR